jgi:hypothetical protein
MRALPLLLLAACTGGAPAKEPGPRPDDPEQGVAGPSGSASGRPSDGASASPAQNAPDDASPGASPESSLATSDARPGDVRAAADGGAVAGDAPTSLPGCAGPASHPVCIDFEAKALDSRWRGAGTSVTVEPGKAAHGMYALHLTNLQPGSSRVISTTQMGTITNVIWGRFYLYMTPGAPNGHGSLVTATDQAGNWYELGFQFNAYHGNWHVPAGVPERWMNSKVIIPGDRWVCVEFLFDGATPAVTKVWSDGVAVAYSQVASSPALVKVQQFRRFEIGFHPSHGTSLKSYEGSTPPATSDVWIDDLALDADRIGCIR